MMHKAIGAALLGAVLLAGGRADADQPYRVVATIKVGGEGSWDYAAYDPGADRLYLTRVGGVQVVAGRTGETAGSIPATAGTRVHGIALASDLGLGMTGDGEDKTSTVFDLKTLKVKYRVKFDLPIDTVTYDPATRLAFAFSGDEGVAVAFAPDTGRIVGRMALDGAVESAAIDGKGRIYVNQPDKNVVAVIDAKSRKVVARWPLGDACQDATPLTVDPAHGRLFSACRSGVAVVLDLAGGHQVATVPIGKGADSAVYDGGAGLAFISCNEGSITAIRAEGQGASVAQSIKTEPGGRIVALDPVGHRLFVPLADLGPMLPKTESAPGRPAIVPETFRILTVAAQ